MRTVFILAAIVGVVWAAVLMVGEAIFPIYTHRIRLTANVTVGNELRSGSSVIEIQWKGHPRIGDSGEFSPRISGDAVFVDLGDGRNLVVALTYGRFGEQGILPIMELRAFGVELSREGLQKLERDLRGSLVELRGSLLPTLITFADLSDPNSARVVTPEDVGEILGKDVRLHSVTMELTDEPITRTLASHLPWLDAMRRREKAEGVSTNSRELNVDSLLLSRGL